MNPNLIIGYWKAPLRGQSIRYLLELSGYPYQEKLYTFNNADEWHKNDKLNLGFQYPNIPYVLHGDVKLTESQNVIDYVIDVTNQQHLLGTGLTKYNIGNVRFVCADLGTKIYLASRKSGEERKIDFEKQINPHIKNLLNHLGNNIYFINNQLSLADVLTYNVLAIFRRYAPEEFKTYQNGFEKFTSNFESIPQIAAYHSSQRYKALIS